MIHPAQRSLEDLCKAVAAPEPLPEQPLRAGPALPELEPAGDDAGDEDDGVEGVEALAA